MNMKRYLFKLAVIATSLFTFANVFALERDSELTSLIEPAIIGDRTGTCLLIASINDTVERTIICADPDNIKQRKLGYDTLLEIGSISKTMTATVLAALIRDSDLSLDDTLVSILPAGTKVPDFNGKNILLKHIVTHTSGLPAISDSMQTANPENPYAKLNTKNLLASLKDVELKQAPGDSFSYSNYAMMLLSYGLANTTNVSFDELLNQYLFEPLKMNSTYAYNKKKGTTLATGHSQTGREVKHWTFKKNLHGVGGIRSSLNDMVIYAQANLGMLDSAVNPILYDTHNEVLSVGGQSMGMNWMRGKLNNRDLLMHEGGTGGFSSLIILDKENQQGVVILADTALTNLGGLGAIARHLLESSIPLPAARVSVAAPEKLLQDLAGNYNLLTTNMKMKLFVKRGKLFAQATGQSAFELGYDSHGNFYPKEFDALLRPTQTSKGWGFQLMQGGAVIMAEPTQKRAANYEVTAATLANYVGYYPLTNGFALSVVVDNDKLTIQGTGQQPLPVDAVSADEFSRDDVGAYFVFTRDESGQVISLTLKQAGQILTGKKQLTP